LIHNTYTPEDDLVWAENENPNLYWVLCPGSNLYIENKLPDAPMFAKYGVKVALGTDSFASNTRLSILREMKILQDAYEIDFETLLLSVAMGYTQRSKSSEQTVFIRKFGQRKVPRCFVTRKF